MRSSEASATTLREAGPADREFLLRAYASTREAELAQVDWSEEQKQLFLRMQFDAQDAHYRAHYPGARFDVIEWAGEPAGRFYVQRAAREIRVMELALLPAYRGRGIGSALLCGVQQEAARGGQAVTIHVEQTNPALRLYQRLGFAAIAEHGIYLLLEWRR